uniref:Carrier domain-containing protein n=1 Tax=Macrostomum lignano TaxID=282301 RepID=A0A1I8HBM3_9PLAT
KSSQLLTSLRPVAGPASLLPPHPEPGVAANQPAGAKSTWPGSGRADLRPAGRRQNVQPTAQPQLLRGASEGCSLITARHQHQVAPDVSADGIEPEVEVRELDAFTAELLCPKVGATVYAYWQQRHHWPPDEFRVIELHHMKLGHFLAYNCLGNAAMHAALYPLALARTRITAQPGRLEYSGFAHCLRSVLAHEGLRGLYAGAWTRAAHVINAALVGVTYETVRASAEPLPAPARGAVAGGCAALASQALLVPADVVTQHIMLLPMARLSPVAATVAMAPGAGWLGQAGAVIRWIRRRHGLAGFYKGGLWSLVLFLPNSAAMWSAYSAYCDWLYRWLDSPPRLAVQLTAAPLAGATAGLLTNPIDVLRLRPSLIHSADCEVKAGPPAGERFDSASTRRTTRSQRSRMADGWQLCSSQASDRPDSSTKLDASPVAELNESNNSSITPRKTASLTLSGTRTEAAAADSEEASLPEASNWRLHVPNRSLQDCRLAKRGSFAAAVAGPAARLDLFAQPLVAQLNAVAPFLLGLQVQLPTPVRGRCCGGCGIIITLLLLLLALFIGLSSLEHDLTSSPSQSAHPESIQEQQPFLDDSTPCCFKLMVRCSLCGTHDEGPATFYKSGKAALYKSGTATLYKSGTATLYKSGTALYKSGSPGSYLRTLTGEYLHEGLLNVGGIQGAGLNEAQSVALGERARLVSWHGAQVSQIALVANQCDDNILIRVIACLQRAADLGSNAGRNLRCLRRLHRRRSRTTPTPTAEQARQPRHQRRRLLPASAAAASSATSDCNTGSCGRCRQAKQADQNCGYDATCAQTTSWRARWSAVDTTPVAWPETVGWIKAGRAVAVAARVHHSAVVADAGCDSPVANSRRRLASPVEAHTLAAACAVHVATRPVRHQIRAPNRRAVVAPDGGAAAAARRLHLVAGGPGPGGKLTAKIGAHQLFALGAERLPEQAPGSLSVWVSGSSWQSANAEPQTPPAQKLLPHGVPSLAATSAGQAAPVPSQNSGRSHWSTAARQTVPVWCGWQTVRSQQRPAAQVAFPASWQVAASQQTLLLHKIGTHESPTPPRQPLSPPQSQASPGSRMPLPQTAVGEFAATGRRKSPQAVDSGRGSSRQCLKPESRKSTRASTEQLDQPMWRQSVMGAAAGSAWILVVVIDAQVVSQLVRHHQAGGGEYPGFVARLIALDMTEFEAGIGGSHPLATGQVRPRPRLPPCLPGLWGPRLFPPMSRRRRRWSRDAGAEVLRVSGGWRRLRRIRQHLVNVPPDDAGANSNIVVPLRRRDDHSRQPAGFLAESFHSNIVADPEEPVGGFKTCAFDSGVSGFSAYAGEMFDFSARVKVSFVDDNWLHPVPTCRANISEQQNQRVDQGHAVRESCIQLVSGTVRNMNGAAQQRTPVYTMPKFSSLKLRDRF